MPHVDLSELHDLKRTDLL